jgi:transposase, IS5 family
MLRERYAKQDIFAEIGTVGLGMEPILQQLDKLLEDDGLFQAVKADLAKRYPQTVRRGRWSTPVEVVLRLLVVKHLYGWSYEQTEQWVNDSIVLRQFSRVYLERVPDDTTLLRWANQIEPDTLQALLGHVVELARQQAVTRGRKLRIDGTVIEANIHHPTDSTLLNDGVRVVSRILSRAAGVLKGRTQRGKSWLKQQVQQARTTMLHISEVARKHGEDVEGKLRSAYSELLAVTEQLVNQADEVQKQLQRLNTTTAQTLAAQIQTFIPRVRQVMAQTTQRVLQGQAVPARQKLASLFEPQTAIIRRGKFATPVEFGRVVWLSEVEGGLVSRYEVLAGNPADADQLTSSLVHHRQTFGHAPHLLTADRKVYSPANDAFATRYGVKYVAIPKPGARSLARQAHEKQPWFRSGRNWRAGIESRISLLKRRYGLRRCLYHGEKGMHRWVGWGIIAYDLHTIARKLAA